MDRHFPGIGKDLRTWINALRDEGQLCSVTAEVDWNCELGTIVRRTYDVYGDASPAMLFENIRGYPPPGPSRLFVGQFRSYYRLAMLFGLDPERATRKDLVDVYRAFLREPVSPVQVKSGPVQENIHTGSAVDATSFPVPLWHHRDGGRYIGTFHGVVTRDLNSGWVNVGLYRVMLVDGQRLAIYLRPGRQHIGQQFVTYKERGERMPVALVIGDPALPFAASTGVARGVCEYDVAGAIKGQPMQLIVGPTSDLPIPATAEIVIEGYIDPYEEWTDEGPFGEYPGYYGEVPGRAPVMHITSILHRDDPIFHGSLEGHPINESHVMASITKTATAWKALEDSGMTGIRDLATLPESASAHIVVSCKPSVPAQADWIASVLWAQSNAIWHWKHVIVVDDDIDPWDSQAVTWAIAWRVKASEDIKIWKNQRGSPIDPRQEPEAKGYWDRVLIDATRPWWWKPNEIWGSEGVGKGTPLNYPPTTIPDRQTMSLVTERWSEYGIKPVSKYIGTDKGMMAHWWTDGGPGETDVAPTDQGGM